MTSRDEKKWLEDAFAELYPKWKTWLRFRYSALAGIHTELLQDAAADLSEYVLKIGKRQLSNAEISKLGFTILKRRVADVFRGKAMDWVEHLPLDLLPSRDRRSDPELVARYAKLLRLLVGLVAQLDRHDRDLLLRDSNPGDHKHVAMTPAERQQLSRLRERLRAELRGRYGIEVSEYLKE